LLLKSLQHQRFRDKSSWLPLMNSNSLIPYQSNGIRGPE
jgi:hypothetical protein